jgi:hypothetical protein
MNKKSDFQKLSQQEKRELKDILPDSETTNTTTELADIASQNFLETEIKRQQKLFEFFSKKVTVLSDVSQSEHLIAEQNEFNEKLSEKISDELSKPESHFMKAMDRLFVNFYQHQGPKE